MCYVTKRKIADCVKQLMHQKAIRKITIQDIMDETNMSRQSFYYHFRDIYDVLDWIAEKDFTAKIECENCENIEDWIVQFLEIIRKEQPFLRKMLKELTWPEILKYIQVPVEKQMKKMLKNSPIENTQLYEKELQFCVEFFSTSFSYYIMDCVYQKKTISNEQALMDLHFLISLLKNADLTNSNTFHS